MQYKKRQQQIDMSTVSAIRSYYTALWAAHPFFWGTYMFQGGIMFSNCVSKNKMHNWFNIGVATLMNIHDSFEQKLRTPN